MSPVHRGCGKCVEALLGRGVLEYSSQPCFPSNYVDASIIHVCIRCDSACVYNRHTSATHVKWWLAHVSIIHKQNHMCGYYRKCVVFADWGREAPLPPCSHTTHVSMHFPIMPTYKAHKKSKSDAAGPGDR